MIELTKEPYELLVRWGGGQIVGAHYKELEILRDGESIVHVKEGTALPLSLGGAELAQILGHLNMTLAARVEELEIRNADLQQKINLLGQPE